jgi:cell division protein FtsA
MKKTEKGEPIIAGLDIGSTKVCVMVARLTETGTEIIGVGMAPSHGLRKGVVVNIDSTTESIVKAIEEAELMAGVEIKDVWVGVAGSHIRSFDSRGMVAIKNREVQEADVKRVIDAAQAVAVPSDRDVIHVIPREFRIDDQEGISDPIGMSGVRLESSVHIVTAGRTALQNLMKCTQRAGLKIKGLALEQLASSLAVLSQDEKDLGVALVDIGGGTSDVIVYLHGSVAYTSVLPLGGSHVTNDVAVGLRTPHANAEDLKRRFGCAMSSLVSGSESIEVPGVGGREPRTVLRQYLCEVIEPRAEEILTFINNELHRSGLSDYLGSGVVLTGGGSQLDGLVEMGEFLLDMPVRKGSPNGFGGLTDIVSSPQFATALGLIRFGASKTPKATVSVTNTNIFTKFKKAVMDAF